MTDKVKTAAEEQEKLWREGLKTVEKARKNLAGAHEQLSRAVVELGLRDSYPEIGERLDSVKETLDSVQGRLKREKGRKE